MKMLYGLVICGGQSSRMGSDKSLLIYHDLPQRYYLYGLLKKLCDQVFICCNSNQAADMAEFYNILVDKTGFVNIGPMAALLTAYKSHPDASFLVVGCDYPFIREKDLKKLIANRDKKKQVVYYYNSDTNFEEPLLAIYENECLPKLVEEFKASNYSLRGFIKSISAERIDPENINILTSVDTEDQYKMAMQIIADSL